MTLRVWNGTSWWPDELTIAGKYSSSLTLDMGDVYSPFKPSAATIGTITNTTSKQLSVAWSGGAHGTPNQTGVNAPYGGVSLLDTAILYRLKNNTTGGTYNAVSSPYANTGLASNTTYNYTVYTGTTYFSYPTASVSKSATTKVDAVRTTKTWSCAWSESYDSSWSKRNTSYLYHGDYGSSANGNQKGLFGFNIGSTIPADATIHSVSLYLYASHWYNNAGGDVTLYLLSSAATAEPSGNPGGSAVSSTTLSWAAKTGGKTIALPVDFGNDLRANGNRIFYLYAPTGTNGYGYFNGNGMSYEPTLTIDYTYYT